MLAIHGIWADGALSLWAEDSSQPGHPVGAARAPRPHPFAAPAGLLADMLAEFGELTADLARKADDGELTLWLPGTAASGPLPSPDLIALRAGPGGPESGREQGRPGRPALAAWLVPALRFAPAAALAVLSAISQPDLAAERGTVAGSMHYLAALGALAADLTARGRVLPGFEQAADGRYLARGARCWPAPMRCGRVS